MKIGHTPKLIQGLIAFVFCCTSPMVWADNSEIQLLREQLMVLSQRLDSLEASNDTLKQENAQLKVASQETASSLADISEQTVAVTRKVNEGSKASSWSDRIKVKGDFRLRHEGINEEGKDSRRRDRIRARAAIIASVSEHGEVGIGMASGGDDPVSTNQTLGGGGSTKGLNLDLAYFSWSGLENSRIVGGKFKNPLYKPGSSALMWDGDWNPEGLGFFWDRGDYFANVLGTWLESDSSRGNQFSYGAQIGLNKSFSDAVKFTAGVSYFSLDTKGKGSFFGDDDDFFGNSFNPITNTYIYDYELIQLFADIGFDFGSQPAHLFVDFVQNQDADQFDTGYSVGFKYGSAKAPGSWQGEVVYQDLEADATLGLLTDSDFAGGGTDGKGFIFKGGYALTNEMKASFTYFLTERDSNAGNPHDYDRFQLDLAVKF